LKQAQEKEVGDKNFEIQKLKTAVQEGEGKLKLSKRERDDLESQKNNQIMQLKQEIKSL
jgi:hypothetical protein